MRSGAVLLVLVCCPHRKKLASSLVFALTPVGQVVGGRTRADAVAGPTVFSHLVVVFQFHLSTRPPCGRALAVPWESAQARGEDDRPEGQNAPPPPRRVAVLDVTPSMAEFEPRAEDVRQPAWSTTLMAGSY